jgi:phospholipid/cholesterol/gamma-HCH transport system substrate-binding protein
VLIERNQVVIGVISAAVIAAGVFFALFMTQGFFEAGHEVTAQFRDAAGVAPGDHVLAAGVRVGQVDSVELNDEEGVVDVTFVVEGELPADTRARISIQNLLGRRQLHLVAGADWGELLQDGSMIPVERTSTPIDVPQYGEESERFAREGDQDALQQIVTALADITEDKRDEVSDLIDGLGRIARVIHEQKDELQGTLDGAERFFAAFRDRDEEIVQIVDAFGSTLEMLVEQRPEIERLLNNVGDANHLLADIVSEERLVIDSVLTELHEAMAVVDDTQVDIAHFFAVAPVVLEGFASVGYDTDGSDTPYWLNMHASQAGAISYDWYFGCGGIMDEALDGIFGEDTRNCREQDAQDPPPPLGEGDAPWDAFFRLGAGPIGLPSLVQGGGS